jgi:hypothetical protein
VIATKSTTPGKTALEAKDASVLDMVEHGLRIGARNKQLLARPACIQQERK